MTDLEGLTQRVRTLSPEQFRVLVAEYHRTLRRVLSESGGIGVASFFDTAIAVYRSARQAAITAAKLQLTVSQHAWPSDERIRIGVALDSGEVVATGYGYFGPAVSRCGKLLERASAGHVLVSEPTNLFEGEDLGELELHESNHFFPLEPTEPRILGLVALASDHGHLRAHWPAGDYPTPSHSGRRPGVGRGRRRS